MAASWRLGRYEMLRLLGEGGTGQVYEAVLHGPAGFRKPVAVKVLRPDVLRPGLIQHEARLGGLLRHPNLVEIYELGEVDGRWFCAMELVTGGTLADRGPWSPRAVVDVGLQVCAGLAYAHEQIGLVHLDVKPQNLLLGDGRVRIADFGLAVVQGEGRARGGTPGFMAPEQFHGDAVDARTDVFALGRVLQSLLAPRAAEAPSEPGRRTWDGTTLPDPGPAEVVEAPPWLLTILERCTATAPDDRFPSARALAEALRALPIASRATGALPVARRPLERSPVGAPPWPHTPWFGDDALLDDLERGLDAGGATVLTGLPGSGKTRGALALAERRRARGEVRWCDASGVTTAEALVARLARAIGRSSRTQDPMQVTADLGSALAHQDVALLVVDAVAPVADLGEVLDALGQSASTVPLVVTAPRPVPSFEARICPVEPLSEAHGVGLLADRARRAGVSPPPPELARRLVSQLDGLPWALELTVSRLRSLGAEALLRRLDQRLDLLATRDRKARHPSLRAALDTAWDTLTADEQAALGRLVGFVDAFRLEDAEAVLDGLGLDVLEVLIEGGWLAHVGGTGPVPRFRLPETVRRYVAEPLEASQRVAVEQAHARHYASLPFDRDVRPGALVAEVEHLVAASERATDQGDVDVAMAAFDRALGALRAAAPPSRRDELATYLLDRLTLPAGARATLGRARGWAVLDAGRLAEARSWFDAARRDSEAAGDPEGVAAAQEALAWAALASGSAVRATDHARCAVAAAAAASRVVQAHAAALAGVVARERGRLVEAQAWLEDAVRGYAAAGARGQSEAVAQANLVAVLYDQGEVHGAETVVERSLATFEAIGDVTNAAVAYGNRGELRAARGDLVGAQHDLQVQLETWRRLGFRRRIPEALIGLARVHEARGAPADARRCLEEGLELASALGDARSVGEVLRGVARVASAEGDPAAAAKALERAHGVFHQVGDDHRIALVELEWAACLAAQGRHDAARALRAEARTRPAAREAAPTSELGRALAALR